jgi:hypothetical protein
MSNSSSSDPSPAGDSVRTIGETLAALRAERLHIDTEYKKVDAERQALERSLTVACRASAGLRFKCSELDKAVRDAEVALKDAISWSEAETADEATLMRLIQRVTTFEQFRKCYERLESLCDSHADYMLDGIPYTLFFFILEKCSNLCERIKILSYLLKKGANPMLVPDGFSWSRHFANVSNSCPRNCDKETLETYLRLVFTTFQMALAHFNTDTGMLEDSSLFLQVVIYEIFEQVVDYDKSFRTPEFAVMTSLQIDIRRLFHKMYDQLLAAIRAHPSTLVQGRAGELTGPNWDTWKHETLKLPRSST